MVVSENSNYLERLISAIDGPVSECLFDWTIDEDIHFQRPIVTFTLREHVHGPGLTTWTHFADFASEVERHPALHIVYDEELGSQGMDHLPASNNPQRRAEDGNGGQLKQRPVDITERKPVICSCGKDITDMIVNQTGDDVAAHKATLEHKRGEAARRARGSESLALRSGHGGTRPAKTPPHQAVASKDGPDSFPLAAIDQGAETCPGLEGSMCGFPNPFVMNYPWMIHCGNDMAVTWYATTQGHLFSFKCLKTAGPKGPCVECANLKYSTFLRNICRPSSERKYSAPISSTLYEILAQLEAMRIQLVPPYPAVYGPPINLNQPRQPFFFNPQPIMSPLMPLPSVRPNASIQLQQSQHHQHHLQQQQQNAQPNAFQQSLFHQAAANHIAQHSAHLTAMHAEQLAAQRGPQRPLLQDNVTVRDGSGEQARAQATALPSFAVPGHVRRAHTPSARRGSR